MSDSSSRTSSTVSTDIIPSSQTSVSTQQPPLNPIPITPSLDTTPVNTPTHTPLQTSVPQETQTSLTLPLSDTEFPFDITPTHSPPPSSFHISDPSDINPTLLRNINNPTLPRLKLIPTSIKSFRRRSQLDNSLSIPPPCSHTSNKSSLPPPKPLKIPVLESLDSLPKKSDLSEIDSTTSSLLYPRLPLSNSASKHTTSSLDNLLILPLNLLFAIPFVTDIISVITVVLLLPLQVLTLLFYATTLNLFLQTPFQTQKTLLPLELILSFPNVPLFLLIIILVTFSLAQLLKTSVFFHLTITYLTLILPLINILLLLHLIVSIIL